MNWNNVTTKQYIELLQLYNKDDLTTGQLTVGIQTILDLKDGSDLSFINEDIPSEPSNIVELNGELYKIDYLKDLKTLEYIDANMTLKEDSYNFGQLLAILCRKDNEVYDDDFIANKLDDRIELFNSASIVKTKPLIDFFVNRANQYWICSQKSLMELPKDRFALHILSLLVHGLLKGCFMRTVKALWTLRKQVKCILQPSQNG